MIKSYVEYDEFGVKQVNCMNCGEVVAAKTYVELPDRENIGKKVKVMAIQRLGNWRQVRVNLEDENGKPHSYMEPIVCAECVNADLDTNNIMKLVRKGWRADMEYAGKTDYRIRKYLKSMDGVRIKRRHR